LFCSTDLRESRLRCVDQKRAWRWLEFWNQLKKDTVRAMLTQTGSLVKEKLLGSLTA
jgi:hypothetical protein